MKYILSALIFAVVVTQTCPAESGFPETKAGEMAYAFCDEGEWGYKIKYCTESSNPIWLSMEDICKPKKKLIYPIFGYNMVDYSIEVEGMTVEQFTAKTAYMLHSALYNISAAYVLEPIDVVAIGAHKKANVTVIDIHQRVDFYNREKWVDELLKACNEQVLYTLLTEMDDMFLNMYFYIDKSSFKYTGFKLLLNPYWDMLFGTIIVVIIWYGLCKLGRKMCARREEKKKQKAAEKEESQPLV